MLLILQFALGFILALLLLAFIPSILKVIVILLGIAIALILSVIIFKNIETLYPVFFVLLTILSLIGLFVYFEPQIVKLKIYTINKYNLSLQQIIYIFIASLVTLINLFLLFYAIYEFLFGDKQAFIVSISGFVALLPVTYFSIKELFVDIKIDRKQREIRKTYED